MFQVHMPFQAVHSLATFVDDRLAELADNALGD
jgi:hypothetical protein